jgi:type I restriction enzyme S subunit
MSEWQMRRLGDLIDIRGGLSYKSKYIDSGDAKLLGMGCVSFSQRFLQGGCRSYAGDYTEKHLVEEGDLVVATRQQSENLPILGFPAMIPSGMKGTDIIVGTNLYKVNNQSNFSNSFLFWLMRGEGYRSHVKACASGSTVRMITKDVILDYCFACPAEKEAEAIATFLDRIEDKIELNLKMNQTLEEIAKAIFKSWFVDFDPVRAKAEGRPTGLPPEISDLFPDELVDSEIGEIPRGWCISTFADVLEIQGGFAFKSKDFGKDGDPVIKIKNIRGDGTVDQFDCDRVAHVDPKLDKFLLRDGDAVIAMTGATVGKVGLMSVIDEKFYLNQRVGRLVSKSSSDRCWYSVLLLRSENTKNFIEGYAYGSAQPNISSKDIGSIPNVTPPYELLKSFNEVVSPLFQRTLVILKENDLLAELRDTLLPRLISGELRIPDAEKFLEEAGI